MRWRCLVSRPLSAAESEFLRRYFGSSLDLRLIRLGRSMGRRSWSPLGNQISLAAAHFRGDELNLSNARTASVLAHEALHVWQRQHGRWVTFSGAWLQSGYALRLFDPYRYASCEHPKTLLELFTCGNIEQQGQIFEDFVLADQRGQDVALFSEVAQYVKSK